MEASAFLNNGVGYAPGLPQIYARLCTQPSAMKETSAERVQIWVYDQ